MQKLTMEAVNMIIILTRCAFRKNEKSCSLNHKKFIYLIDYQVIKYHEQLHSKL
jgi:hypothetical protein